MTVRDVLLFPDPRLRRKARAVRFNDSADRAAVLALAQDLRDSVFDDDAGLAAPQIGADLRVIILNLRGQPVRICVNPTVVSLSQILVAGEEGCLSLPGAFGKVLRFPRVRVAWVDERGENAQEIVAEGFEARAFQHEVDHLDGKLFVDRVSSLQRSLLLRRARKDGALIAQARQRAARP